MNVMIEWVLVIALVTAGAAIVLMASSNPLEQMQSSIHLSEAERAMNSIADAIQTVGREGAGSSRTVAVPSAPSGQWRISADENLIGFDTQSSVFPPLSRNFLSAYLVAVAGNDVSCYSGSWKGIQAWVMENSYVKAYLQRIENGTINTGRNILAIHSKVTNITVEVADSSVEIDGASSTTQGAGFSEMKTGVSEPRCRARFFINSTSLNYDIFYTLYAGADFILAEVRNIK